MKQNPLLMVFVAQLVVLVCAVGFLIGRASAPAAPPPPPHAEAEGPEADLAPLPPPHPAAPAPAPHPAPASAAPVEAEKKADAGGTPEEWATLGHPAPPAPPEKKEPPPVPPPVAAGAEQTFEGLVSELVAGNARFVDGATRQRDLLGVRASLATEEHADAVVVACTDSRVVPEALFDQPLGTFAVVRVPGGQLDEPSARAVDDAIARLHPRVVLVLGHTTCSHTARALDRAPASRPAHPSTLATALGGLHAADDEQASEVATSFAARELSRRSKLLGREGAPTLLRVLYATQTGRVRWLDAEQADGPPATDAPRAGRK